MCFSCGCLRVFRSPRGIAWFGFFFAVFSGFPFDAVVSYDSQPYWLAFALGSAAAQSRGFRKTSYNRASGALAAGCQS